MKLKVQFARSKGWSPKVGVASAPDRRADSTVCVVRPALVPLMSFRRIHLPVSGEIVSAVPGRPEASAKNNPVI